jgi:LysM repeat protein
MNKTSSSVSSTVDHRYPNQSRGTAGSRQETQPSGTAYFRDENQPSCPAGFHRGSQPGGTASFRGGNQPSGPTSFRHESQPGGTAASRHEIRPSGTADPQVTAHSTSAAGLSDRAGLRSAVHSSASTQPSTTGPQSDTTYVWQPGDTLYLVARKFGIGLSDLITANPDVEDPGSIQVGQLLTIPSPSQASPRIRCLLMSGDKLTPRAEGAVIIDYQRGRISVLVHDLPAPSHLSCETYKVWIHNRVTRGYDVAILYPTPAGVWAAGLQVRSPLRDYDGVIITGESSYNDERPLGPVAVSAAVRHA